MHLSEQLNEISYLTEIIKRLPVSGKFGKIISIMALSIAGYYYVGEFHAITDFDRRVLNSIVYYNSDNHYVDFALFGYSGEHITSDKIVLNFNKEDGISTILVDRVNYTNDIKAICDNLGYNTEKDYMEFSLILDSVIALLAILVL